MRREAAESEVADIIERRARRHALLTGLACGLGALLLYWLTADPGVGWQDTSVHQLRIVTGWIENPYGLALSHPLHYWLGRLAIRLPGEPAWLLNLMSGLFGAVGVGMIAAIVTSLTARPAAGVFGAMTAGLAHSFWQLSVVTETYTLAAALMTIEWAVLLAYVRSKRPLLIVTLLALNGLHIANHLLGTLTLATYGVLLIWLVTSKRLQLRWAAAALVAWSVTSSPYWALVASHWLQHGDLLNTLNSAFFGEGISGEGYSAEVFNMRLGPSVLKNGVLWLGYNLPSLAGLAALAGLIRKPVGRDKVFYVVMAAQAIIIVLFVVRYAIMDIYTYFVPVAAVAGLWAGVGADRLLSAVATRPRRIALATLLTISGLMPVGVYAVVPELARQRGLFASRLRDLPYRDEYAYYFSPWRFQDNSAARVARDLIELAGPDGWILGDLSSAYAVAYTRSLTGWRPETRVYAGPFPLGIDEPRGQHVAAMREHLSRGGRAVGMPFPGDEPDWGMFRRVPRGEHYWELKLPD